MSNETIDTFVCPECYTSEIITDAVLGTVECDECGNEMTHRQSLPKMETTETLAGADEND